MAVTFVGASSLVNSGTTPQIDITSFTTPVGEYILIAVIINKDLISIITPPDGTWTEVIQGINDCTTAADDHVYAIYWKRVTADDGGDVYSFFKDIDDNKCFAGCILTFTGAISSGDILDAAGVGVTETAAAADNVSFPAFDPVEINSHIVFVAFYGNDQTSYSAAMSSDTNPDCTIRVDFETGTGTDASIAVTSGDTTDGSNIAARTWASNSTTNAGNTGVVLAIKPEPVAAATARLLALMGVGQ
jgi:hypothetical protein